MKYYINPFINIFNYKGRASLKEFWYFFIINAIIATILVLTKKIHGIDSISIYYRYVYLLPFYSLGFRRLQDTGKSGWLFLIPIVNLILALFSGEKEANKYGEPVSE